MFDFTQARLAMVNSQVRPSDVTDTRLQDAMAVVARERFVPKAQAARAYADAEIRLNNGRALLRPRDFSKLVQAAGVKPGDVVLDIACGLGYSTAVLARMAETVVGLEDDAALAAKAGDRLAEAGADNAVVVDGPLDKGVPGQGPFNVIVVNGAVSTVPEAWLDQLADGGRLAVIVREGEVGRARIYTRAGQAVGERAVFDAAPPYLPGFEPAPGFVF
ncbi:protein-L-isoaspartate O-methyltransferase [Alkalicaulis satelles]|uniref:Protein-L-isoaspartate O-methyltransferase n=1 Tax=Alkalicaulis satelles TaxID=2609175 RepID=A0A5M6ZQQ5_9PROT|nr:protein-L-isoaspartate O-methyltransferase [Alkalicaulis satelles]KAA5804611.1 protein-L-isoaspartate O-methyltransferase [Alkalicaulis satelles]